MSKIKIDINEMLGFNKKNKEKFLEAVRLLEDAINRPLFDVLVLGHTYPMGGHDVKGFYNCQLTNKEVLDMVKSGKDKYGEADGDIDVKIKLYYSWRRTVGYTYPNTPWVYVNKRYFWNPKQIAANLLHESAHNMGLGHAHRWHKRRKYSAPYALGNILLKVMG